jgi:hypothetical protein
MITRMVVDGTILMDREDLAGWLRRPAATIRAKCRPIASDVRTRRALYNAETCQARLERTKRRDLVAKPCRSVAP